MARPTTAVDPKRGERIREALAAANMTAVALAERVGCHPVYLARVIAGDRQGGKYAPEIAKALGVTPEWLEHGGPTAKAPTSPYLNALAHLAAAERETQTVAARLRVDPAVALKAIDRARALIEKLAKG